MRQELHKATQAETGLHATLKKTRANHARSVAEVKRLKTSIDNQQRLVDAAKGVFSPKACSPHFNPPSNSKSSSAKKARVENPYAKPTVLDFFNDSEEDDELARALEESTKAKYLGDTKTVIANNTENENKTNRTKRIIGTKTAGEEPEDYNNDNQIGNDDAESELGHC